MGLVLHNDDDEPRSRGASWNVKCTKDPRFNMSGYSSSIWSASSEMNEAIKRKAKELGMTLEEAEALQIEVQAWKD